MGGAPTVRCATGARYDDEVKPLKLVMDRDGDGRATFESEDGAITLMRQAVLSLSKMETILSARHVSMLTPQDTSGVEIRGTIVIKIRGNEQ